MEQVTTYVEIDAHKKALFVAMLICNQPALPVENSIRPVGNDGLEIVGSERRPERRSRPTCDRRPAPRVPKTVSSMTARHAAKRVGGDYAPRGRSGRSPLWRRIQSAKTRRRCRSLSGLIQSRHSQRAVPMNRSRWPVGLPGACRCLQHAATSNLANCQLRP
jgi:hypothetical protein